MTSVNKHSGKIEQSDRDDTGMDNYGPLEHASGRGNHGSPPGTASHKGREQDPEAGAPVPHGSSHVVLQHGDPRHKLVAEDPNIPRKIRNKVHASQEPAAEGHAKPKAGRETEHHHGRVARTPVAEALAPMEPMTGRLASKAELKAHLQEVEAAHQHESRYTAKLWHNDPATKLAGYTKSMRNMIGDDRRAHYGVPQSRRTQS